MFSFKFTIKLKMHGFSKVKMNCSPFKILLFYILRIINENKNEFLRPVYFACLEISTICQIVYVFSTYVVAHGINIYSLIVQAFLYDITPNRQLVIT